MRVASLILNIIGFVLSIPTTLCVGCIGGGLAAVAESASEFGGTNPDIQAATGIIGLLAGSTTVIFIICLAALVLGIIAFAKPKTPIAVIGGILLIVAGLLQLGLIWVGGILGLIAGICLILAGIFAIAAKKPQKA